jgi:hypothetical protein
MLDFEASPVYATAFVCSAYVPQKMAAPYKIISLDFHDTMTVYVVH